jgi:hypothetical protein
LVEVIKKNMFREGCKDKRKVIELIFNSFGNEELGIIDHKKWDKDITTVSPYCGKRFSCLVQNNVIWDDLDLLSECPLCGGELRYNSFIVDNKARWD